MKCCFCKKEMNLSSTDYMSRVASGIAVIRNVPCYECPDCGEKFFSDEVMSKLEMLLTMCEKLPVVSVTLDYTAS